MSTRADFAKAVIFAGGWSQHLNNHVALVAWMEGENTLAKYNPFATSHPMPGATNFNSSGVKNYVSFSQGVQATVETIRLTRYAEIVKNLEEHSSAFYTLTAVEASGTWTQFDNLSTFVENIRASWTRYAFKPIAT